MTSAPAKKSVSYKNLLIGAVIQVFEVSTLGQPFEVLKTQMAANSKQNLITATKVIYNSSGLQGFWRGLIPWAWIEVINIYRQVQKEQYCCLPVQSWKRLLKRAGNLNQLQVSLGVWAAELLK